MTLPIFISSLYILFDERTINRNLTFGFAKDNGVSGFDNKIFSLPITVGGKNNAQTTQLCKPLN